MNEGEVKEISDLSLVNDLIDAGLVKKEEDKPKRKRGTKK